MQAEQLVREGKLDEALADLQSRVRSDPANAPLRVFLFQLLLVRGEWDRAMTQLGVASELDAANLLMAQVCQRAVKCEALRHAVFEGRRTPLVFGEPAEWVGLLVESLRLMTAGHHEQAAKLRDEAFEAAPAVSGTADGKAFEWLADADMRLGPVFEAMIEGKYYWVPMFNVRRLRLEEPTDLRDTVWLPGEFLWTNGGKAIALLPVRYHGTESTNDDALRLARRTDFEEPAPGTFVGLGQRVWATDQGDAAMLATREIVFGDPITDDEDAAAHATEPADG